MPDPATDVEEVDAPCCEPMDAAHMVGDTGHSVFCRDLATAERREAVEHAAARLRTDREHSALARSAPSVWPAAWVEDVARALAERRGINWDAPEHRHLMLTYGSTTERALADLREEYRDQARTALVALEAVGAIGGGQLTAGGEHRYLSTGCLHGEHGHCRSAVNVEGGSKTPGTCKFCPATCVCRCHAEVSG